MLRRRMRYPVPVLGFLMLACSSLVGPAFETSVPTLEPRGLLGMAGSDAHCQVKNLGNAPAPATVTFTVKLKDGTTTMADEYVMLQPKELKTVDHAFYTLKIVDPADVTIACKAVVAK